MLRLGPPQIVTAGVPLKVNAFDSVGCVMMIGIGDITSTIPAIAVACTVEAEGTTTLSRRSSVVLTFRDTVARIRTVGSVLEKDTPGAAEVAGKSIVTVSDAVEPKPFLDA
jgi:hypothetical protein